MYSFLLERFGLARKEQLSMKGNEMSEHIGANSSVKLLLQDYRGRVLLLRRSEKSKHFKYKWELSGGKVDSGESLEVALRRELKEETGLACDVLTVLGDRRFDIDEIPCHETLFRARLVGQADVHLSDEHDDYRWVTLESLRTESKETPLLPGIVEFIKKCKELHND